MRVFFQYFSQGGLLAFCTVFMGRVLEGERNRGLATLKESRCSVFRITSPSPPRPLSPAPRHQSSLELGVGQCGAPIFSGQVWCDDWVLWFRRGKQ